MRYDFSAEFEGMDNAAIVRVAIGPQQRSLLRAWMGVGPTGAQKAIGQPLPADLAEPSLHAYHEIARRMLASDNDPRGTQAARIALIEQAMDRLHEASSDEVQEE